MAESSTPRLAAHRDAMDDDSVTIQEEIRERSEVLTSFHLHLGPHAQPHSPPCLSLPSMLCISLKPCCCLSLSHLLGISGFCLYLLWAPRHADWMVLLWGSTGSSPLNTAMLLWRPVGLPLREVPRMPHTPSSLNGCLSRISPTHPHFTAFLDESCCTLISLLLFSKQNMADIRSSKLSCLASDSWQIKGRIQKKKGGGGNTYKSRKELGGQRCGDS